MAGNLTQSDIWLAISQGHRVSCPGILKIETLAAHLTVDETYGNILMLDGDGARNVLLPALEDGAIYLIINGGGETLTIQNAAGVAVTGSSALATAKAGIYVCDGVTWYGVIMWAHV